MTEHQHAAEALGDRLAEEWSKNGQPSFEKLARLVYDDLGTEAVSKEAIRKWHRGLVSPHGINLAAVCVLARFYDVTVASLSPILGERLAREKSVLMQTPGWVTAENADGNLLVTTAA